MFSSFDSLACAISDTASAADLLYPWQLCVQILRDILVMLQRRS